MNSGPMLFLSAFLAISLSFWGLILGGQKRVGSQNLVPLEPSKALYPSGRLGLAKRGADVYRAHGCAECHTQQVRPEGYGGDFDRGWGARRTVAQDFLLDDPVMLGQVRIGPDLANVGARLPDADWHYRHLYAPKSEVPNSTMPPYTFLFEEVPAGSSSEALTLGQDHSPGEGKDVVPTIEARALVAYLLSLKTEVTLYEAPLPEPDTNAPPDEATSEPAGETPVEEGAQ